MKHNEPAIISLDLLDNTIQQLQQNDRVMNWHYYVHINLEQQMIPHTSRMFKSD
jgi:hypothetical protein